ncbi:MAG TPA: hypothetical protein DEA65_00325 [Candidatus Marinimicrobia bacterium]|jgi:hypothetical protein|nr:hypothetical protein [Candidatus Neomarinimicrobiota bacterium]MDP5957199.1 hypothetical protein [Candidatus Neomarinimicrobiota bacterium]MDP6499769.1 hypothetical protein [Candidatus Neomarinimicrobiota bacterium]MDP7094687.1 hypothetical protein [Candidatus Neomarinimicrobiota bacterium]MDP7329882.1 hypothetical protein [Candidatus Neomarinimicrobiota bacterium]|tara:strand:+ start:243 stop:623 length:381 start_codon:yes stop_codon:yes gene_type:complete
MTEEKKYKGSKTKVESLVKKLIKDNMYDPNDEEHWLIDEYDRFNHHAKESLNVFEKYYGAVWDDLKKMRRMNIEIFSEHLENPNYYLMDLLVSDFIKKTVKRKDLKSPLMLQKLQIVYINDRIILN